ncbi:M42 family metallopeptidase [Listeria booriae]|uniref:M42 family metallopeptidase n=1 Tax=Listeria booriae TaxID=1552123 RepID=A0A7X0Z6F4_9LIST|nr:M42 family metallopeptidase [Listeria booriae]MBC1209629.1 M42 family metallopeptidase [Listeria booriae]MBC1226286.1 M42 family metallopeptidase [Listeria booriae]MBC1232987.1 M42 family metallopeptidase [Listeria booriae]MBC1245499.1 M42 family metallopeptidase [Listeria booriae]MBC1272214.1 M42 family metallopeptidase [Listeria booriae]
MDKQLQMLKELTDAKGISGNERAVREVFKQYIEPLADTFETDGLGSAIATKTGDANGPKVMIAGHLDEVGFMVTQIDENGFIKFQTIGGWVSSVMLAQRVTIVTRSGEEITGVIGSKPPHLMTAAERQKAFDIKDMFIDVGAANKEEVVSWGIKPGDMIVPAFEFTVMKNEKYLLAKAWDNRIGLAIAIEVLRNLKGENHPNIVYGVGTVQEEVGLRGAKTSAHQIMPDIAFGVDVGIAGDTPGVTAKEAVSKMGEGPQIIIYDASMISHAPLRNFVTDVADELEIPYQFEAIAAGGTDSGAIHLTGNGIPSLSITIATRYIHSHTSMLHRDDFTNAVKLITEVVKRLDADKVSEIRLG